MALDKVKNIFLHFLFLREHNLLIFMASGGHDTSSQWKYVQRGELCRCSPSTLKKSVNKMRICSLDTMHPLSLLPQQDVNIIPVVISFLLSSSSSFSSNFPPPFLSLLISPCSEIVCSNFKDASSCYFLPVLLFSSCLSLPPTPTPTPTPPPISPFFFFRS